MRPGKILGRGYAWARLAIIGLLAACALQQPLTGAELCRQAFEEYDRAEHLFPAPTVDFEDDVGLRAAGHSRLISRLRQAGCITYSDDLAGLEAARARLAGFRPTDSGAPIRPTPVHVGVITSITDEQRVTAYFRGLGYRSRGIGADGLGRRIYIGPFLTEGALEQAMDVARQAGFISPYPPRYTRF